LSPGATKVLAAADVLSPLADFVAPGGLHPAEANSAAVKLPQTRNVRRVVMGVSL